jgi:hypothetical protein
VESLTLKARNENGALNTFKNQAIKARLCAWSEKCQPNG